MRKTVTDEPHTEAEARALMKVCNCADCGKELTSSDTRIYFLAQFDTVAGIPEAVECYVNGRPYCHACTP